MLIQEIIAYNETERRRNLAWRKGDERWSRGDAERSTTTIFSLYSITIYACIRERFLKTDTILEKEARSSCRRRFKWQTHSIRKHKRNRESTEHQKH